MSKFLQSIFAPGVSSEQWNLNKFDYIKAFLLGLFAVPITMLFDSILTWANGKGIELTIDWDSILKACVISIVTYLVKNYFSPSSNPPLK